MSISYKYCQERLRKVLQPIAIVLLLQTSMNQQSSKYQPTWKWTD